MKQETLEEFIKSIYPPPSGAKIRGIELGAKWQQERSYSEEDLKTAFDAGYKNEFGNYFRYWFEQFKKK